MGTHPRAHVFVLCAFTHACVRFLGCRMRARTFAHAVFACDFARVFQCASCGMCAGNHDCLLSCICSSVCDLCLEARVSVCSLTCPSCDFCCFSSSTVSSSCLPLCGLVRLLPSQPRVVAYPFCRRARGSRSASFHRTLRRSTGALRRRRPPARRPPSTKHGPRLLGAWPTQGYSLLAAPKLRLRQSDASSVPAKRMR
eukprot:6031232-Pleurochrysis_carterae.AAC.6